MKKLLSILAIATLIAALPSCKGKEKDADVKTAIETTLNASPDFAGLVVDVKDGVATITGEAKDAAAKAAAETAAAGVKGVKSVVNNATVYVAPPPPPVPAVNDAQADALSKAVTDALKDYPTVKATVKDQVVYLTGEIKKTSLQKLMIGLNALKPIGLKNIDSKELVKK